MFVNLPRSGPGSARKSCFLTCLSNGSMSVAIVGVFVNRTFAMQPVPAAHSQVRPSNTTLRKSISETNPASDSGHSLYGGTWAYPTLVYHSCRTPQPSACRGGSSGLSFAKGRNCLGMGSL